MNNLMNVESRESSMMTSDFLFQPCLLTILALHIWSLLSCSFLDMVTFLLSLLAPKNRQLFFWHTEQHLLYGGLVLMKDKYESVLRTEHALCSIIRFQRGTRTNHQFNNISPQMVWIYKITWLIFKKHICLWVASSTETTAWCPLYSNIIVTVYATI
jgi:hypothetical protein